MVEAFGEVGGVLVWVVDEGDALFVGVEGAGVGAHAVEVADYGVGLLRRS